METKLNQILAFKQGSNQKGCFAYERAVLWNDYLSIDYMTKEDKVAFKLVNNCEKETDFPKRNHWLAWNRLVIKYEPHYVTALVVLLTKIVTVKQWPCTSQNSLESGSIQRNDTKYCYYINLCFGWLFVRSWTLINISSDMHTPCFLF